MKTERMLQPSASQPPRRRRRRGRFATDGLEVMAAAPERVEALTEEPVSSGVRRLRLIVERLLEQAPGDALCDACLAFAAEAALIDMRHATGELPSSRPGIERGAGRCQSCRRETLVTVYRTQAAV
jgi:hypothetical protein